MASSVARDDYFGWRVEENQLMLGGESVRSVADRFDTPLYLYDETRIRDRANTLKEAFGEFAVLYAIKANPQIRLCRLLAEAGFLAEVSSRSEFDLAVEVGYEPSDIEYVGPGKRLADIRSAAELGCGVFYAESATELRRLEEVAHEQNRRLPVALRINTQHRPTAAGELMAGGPSEFGIDEESLPSLLATVNRERLDLLGFHTFVASQVMDFRSLERHFERVAALAQHLSEEHDVDLRLVNFGGGFGIPYTTYERPLDLLDLGQSVTKNRTVKALQEKWPAAQLYLDVGRYLVGDAGVYLTRIVDVKKSRGSTFVIVDCGITGFARPAMPWAQPHPCCVADRVNGSNSRSVLCSVVGPSCMPGDLLARSVELVDPTPGDVLAFMNAGAYGKAMSLLSWGGFDQPREANFDGADVHLD